MCVIKGVLPDQTFTSTPGVSNVKTADEGSSDSELKEIFAHSGSSGAVEHRLAEQLSDVDKPPLGVRRFFLVWKPAILFKGIAVQATHTCNMKP